MLTVNMIHCGCEPVLMLTVTMIHCGCESVLVLTVNMIHCGCESVMMLTVNMIHCGCEPVLVLTVTMIHRGCICVSYSLHLRYHSHGNLLFLFGSIFIPLNNTLSVLMHWYSIPNDNCHYTVNKSATI